MKKYKLNLKTMITDTKIVGFNVFIISITIFAILSYFGGAKGKQFKDFFGYNHSFFVKSEKDNLRQTIDTLSKIDYITYVIQDNEIKNFNNYFIIPTTVSEGYNFENNITGNGITILSNRNDVLVHNEFLSENRLKIDEVLIIDNEQYKIVGSFVHNFGPEIVIFTEEAYENFKTDLAMFEIIVEADLVSDSASLAGLAKKFEEVLDANIKYTNFKDFSSTYLNDFKVYTIILFIASTVNFIYLYQYILSRREKKMRIYKIVGASKKFIIRFIILDLILIYSISYIISVLLTLCVNGIFLPRIFDEYSFYLTISDYIQYYFIPMFIYLIFVILYYTQQSNKFRLNFRKKTR